MNEIQKLINKTVIPIRLTEEVFLINGKQRNIPDIIIIMTLLPENLRAVINENGSVLCKRQREVTIFQLQLINEDYLIIKIHHNQIIELLYAFNTH